MPSVLDGSPLSTPDEDEFSDRQRPGAPCLDAPVSIDGADAWFLNQLGDRFVGIYFSGGAAAELDAVSSGQIPVDTLIVTEAGNGGNHIVDKNGLLHRHYDARPGTYYLVRPDQHVAGRWREFNGDKVSKALARATGL